MTLNIAPEQPFLDHWGCHFTLLDGDNAIQCTIQHAAMQILARAAGLPVGNSVQAFNVWRQPIQDAAIRKYAARELRSQTIVFQGKDIEALVGGHDAAV
jgi:Protein of unknown function (DUF1488)